MFKGNRKYYAILVFVFAAIVVVQYLLPTPTNWNKTYLRKDKIPFGSYAIFELLENTYAPEVAVNKQSLYNLDTEEARDQSMVMVNDEISIKGLDLHSLFAFLQKGNKVLLCASQFGGKLADTLKLETTYNWSNFFVRPDSLMKKPSFELHFVQPKNNRQGPYAYPEAAVESYFTRFDTALFRVMAVDKKNAPVLIAAAIGKGRLYISTTPDAFANVFVVNHKSRYFAYSLLSLMKSRRLIWDEYYKSFNVQSVSPFKFIFENDALYMAYSILILGIIVFMIFELKRRQRAIPVVSPLENSTLQFVDVISNVYYNSNNHLHIAKEQIGYFYFEIRQKFQVNTNLVDDELFEKVSRLSGVDLAAVRTLFMYCEKLKAMPAIDEYTLLELNDRINNFKQKSIR